MRVLLLKNGKIEMEKCKCGGEYKFIAYCGAHVCVECENHRGMARCYCGWSLSGRNGRVELEEMGEVIGEDLE
jgi:hypothetical protein